jgi:hypothetical protein
MINAIKMLDNKEKTPVSLILDGGYTYPAYAQALHAVAEAQGLTHGYISCDPAAELKSNYKTAIVEYKNSLNINSALSSFFTGWVNVFDSYNQTKVKVAPDGFAAARQAFTTQALLATRGGGSSVSCSSLPSSQAPRSPSCTTTSWSPRTTCRI